MRNYDRDKYHNLVSHIYIYIISQIDAEMCEPENDGGSIIKPETSTRCTFDMFGIFWGT